MKIRLDSGCLSLSEYVNEMPARFGREGRQLFKARNEVRLMEADGCRLAVKRFKRMGLFGQVGSLFRSGKALRSYSNACRLTTLGVPTPRPVACIEKRNVLGFLKDSYYICDYIDLPPICDGLAEDGYFNREMTQAFARFVASLHDKGVLHHDLNNTNVRFSHDGKEYKFTLIDINRMKIYPPSVNVPLDECLLNITRFSCLSDMFRCFLSAYLQARNLPESLFDRAIAIKKRHDRAYARNKRISSFFKNICRRQASCK